MVGSQMVAINAMRQAIQAPANTNGILTVKESIEITLVITIISALVIIIPFIIIAIINKNNKG